MTDTTAPNCPVCNHSLNHAYVWRGFGRRLHDLIVCLGCATALDRLARPVRALTQRELLTLDAKDAAALRHVQQAVRGAGKLNS